MAPPPPHAGSVLLELLEHADVATLSVLLAADNLLALLRLGGWPDARIRRAFAVEGRRPGELLLELLRGGQSADALLASLGPAALARASGQRPRADDPAALAEASGGLARAAGAAALTPARRAAEARWGMSPPAPAPRGRRG